MIDIIKASGEKEKFSKEKLYRSLKRSGIKPKLADKVCQEVAKTIRPGTDSGEVLEWVARCLKEENPILAARYNLKRAIMELGPTGFPYFFHQAWLVTNTKCSGQALRYAKCAGLKIISWHYPRNESLEYLIEKKGLYPITILPSLTRYAKERLDEKRIILAKDLLKYSANDLARFTGLQSNIVKKLREEPKNYVGVKR